MDTQKWLEEFHQATAVPLRFYCGKTELLFLPDSCFMEFDMKQIAFLKSCNRHVCYTVTMEQIAYGLIKDNHSTLIIGPVPCLEILGSLLREAVLHADLSTKYIPSVKMYLEDIAIMPLPRFLNTLSFISHALFDKEHVEPFFLEEMAETSSHSEITEDEQLDLENSDSDMKTYDFATLQMYAIYQGLPDDIAAHFSRIDEYFPPVKYKIHSQQRMHDTVLFCLGRSVQAAVMAGVSPLIVEPVRLKYQENLSKLTSVRSMVKLLKTILIDFASRVRTTKNLHFQDGLSLRIAQEIDQGIYQKITPSHIAERMHMNVNYLCTHFKSTTGMTINEYITQEKIETAKYLLCTTKQSVTQISAQLCFSSSCYFSSVFKKSTGITPVEYRKRHTS